MSAIDRIVTVVISLSASTTPRKGFGTPTLAAYHTLFNPGEYVREYTNLAAAVADGVVASTPIWRALNTMFSQSPRPQKVKLAKRDTAPSQSIKVTPVFTDATGHEGFVYSFTFTEPDGTQQTATYEVASSDTVELICDGLKTAIDALSMAVTVTDNATDIDIDADNAGELFDIVDNNFKLGEGNCKIKDLTADPGLAADLAAIYAYDDDWYRLALDSNSEAESLVAMTWAEANLVQFFTDSYDSEVYDSAVTNDHFSDAKTAARKRSAGIFGGSVLSYAGAGLAGRMSPFDPGEFNPYLKTISGVNAVKLNSTRQTNIRNKYGNVYVLMGGQNGLQDAQAFDGQFIDIQPLLDYLYINIQAAVLDVIRGPAVFPYTDESVSAVKGAILGELKRKEGKGLVADSSTVTAPLVADVSASNKANRILPDVEFNTIAAGAIHKVQINGLVTV